MKETRSPPRHAHNSTCLYVYEHDGCWTHVCRCMDLCPRCKSFSYILGFQQIQSSQTTTARPLRFSWIPQNILIFKQQCSMLSVCCCVMALTNILTLSSSSCRTTTTRGVRQRGEGKRVRQREQGKIEGERSW